MLEWDNQSPFHKKQGKDFDMNERKGYHYYQKISMSDLQHHVTEYLLIIIYKILLLHKKCLGDPSSAGVSSS